MFLSRHSEGSGVAAGRSGETGTEGSTGRSDYLRSALAIRFYDFNQLSIEVPRVAMTAWYGAQGYGPIRPGH